MNILSQKRLSLKIWCHVSLCCCFFVSYLFIGDCCLHLVLILWYLYMSGKELCLQISKKKVEISLALYRSLPDKVSCYMLNISDLNLNFTCCLQLPCWAHFLPLSLWQSAKMFNYAGWRNACNYIFIVFAAIFIITRLVIFPFRYTLHHHRHRQYITYIFYAFSQLFSYHFLSLSLSTGLFTVRGYTQWRSMNPSLAITSLTASWWCCNVYMSSGPSSSYG